MPLTRRCQDARFSVVLNDGRASEAPRHHVEWTPQKGWASSGGEWTEAISRTRGVFAKTAEAVT